VRCKEEVYMYCTREMGARTKRGVYIDFMSGKREGSWCDEAVKLELVVCITCGK
jgi:hypothetical protein